MESSQKRAAPPNRLRVSTQADLAAASVPEGRAVLGAAAALIRRVRAAALLVACVAFVASAALALVVPRDGTSAVSAITADGRGLVISVDPSSRAWGDGIRPGWQLVSEDPSFTTYSLGSNIRLLPKDVQVSGLEALVSLAPAFIALLLAGLLVVAGLRRTGSTLAVAAAVMSCAVWATRLGIVGEGIAVLPAGLAGAMAWQVACSIGMQPRFAQPRFARPRFARPRFAVETLAPLGLVVASGAVFVAAALSLGLVAGVAAASTIYIAVAWIMVVRWRVAIAATRGDRSRLAVARAVATDMLPFSDRARRRGAQAERDRLASDLHAEVLPAIASTAAALERRGATDEAEELRNLAANVRDLVSDRRLPILDDGGLVAAAEWLAESLQARAELSIDIDLRGDTGIRQPRSIERAAYRILQLALENVIRHAEADNASVAISGGAHSLALSVADDGKGIGRDNAARAMSAGRLGLTDMRAEADSVGASLEIGPRSPQGTVVSMRWRG